MIAENLRRVFWVLGVYEICEKPQPHNEKGVKNILNHSLARLVAHFFYLFARPTWAHRACVVYAVLFVRSFDVRTVAGNDHGPARLPTAELRTLEIAVRRMMCG